MAAIEPKTRHAVGYELYTGSVQLGLILRPVKTTRLAIRARSAQNGAAMNATETAIAGDNAKKIGEALRAKLSLADEIRNRSTSNTDDEYGPYIVMPLPEKIKDALKVNYSTVDMGVAAAAAMFGTDVRSGFENQSLANAMTGNASYLLRTFINSLNSGIASVSQKMAGSIPNPFSATIFERVTPRSFNFSWTIQPMNPEESERLRKIINTLRYWSLPNPSKDRLVLAVPYEWELAFTGTGFLYSFSRCVMSGLDIDYSPNGFNSFMPDASPQSVTISIEFQEIYPLDKEVIDSSKTSMKPEYTENREPDPQAEERIKQQSQSELSQQLKGANAELAAKNKAFDEAQKKYTAAVAKAEEIGEPNGLVSGPEGGDFDSRNAQNELEKSKKALDSAFDNKIKAQNEVTRLRNLAQETGGAVVVPGG